MLEPRPTNRNRVCVALVAILGLAAFNAAADESAQKRQEMQQQIIDHIATIKGPHNFASVVVKASDGIQSFSQRVEVIGTLPQASVDELVQLALGDEKRYSLTNGEDWLVTVTGDTRYAHVKIEHPCDALCGYGANIAYAFERGRWVSKFGNQWMQ